MSIETKEQAKQILGFAAVPFVVVFGKVIMTFFSSFRNEHIFISYDE